MNLRPYQVDSIQKLRACISHGMRRVVLVMPTGGGKTVVAAEMVRSAVAHGNRVLFIAHRKELIDQTVDKLSRSGVSAGVIMANDRRRNDYLPVQVCSVQTLIRRLDRLPTAKLVIVDECHHATSDSYRKIIDSYPEAVTIGLTATPWRSDRVGLASVFDGHVLAATVTELTQLGALVEYDAYAYDAPDLHDVGIVAGEYNQKQLGLACNTGVLVGAVVREYLTHGSGRRGVVFPVNIEHSRSLVDEFMASGVIAAHIDCKTPKKERENILKRLHSGTIQVVCSVGVLTEGWDCPPAEIGMIARPTKSLTLHLQILGRLLRPSPETGKRRALIHDHAGNLMRHGFAEDERDYSLTATPNRVRELHTCPLCHLVFGSVRTDGRCPKCGELIAPPRDPSEPGSREQKQQIDGERIAAEAVRARRAAAVVAATAEEKAAEYLRLRTQAERKGYKPGWIGHKFKAIFGGWPSFRDEDLAAVKPATVPFAMRYKR